MKLKQFLIAALALMGGVISSSAYEVGQDITNLAPANWTGASGTYSSQYPERYLADGFSTGDIMTMTINGLESEGYYEVQFMATTNRARGGAAVGANIAQAFLNDVTYPLWVGQNDAESPDVNNAVRLVANVTNGTIKFGIKNVANGGQWYLAKLKSVKYLGKKATSASPLDVTQQYLTNPSFETGNIDGWTNSGNVALGWLATHPGNQPKVGGAFVEKWAASGNIDLNQTTSEMPAGKYRIGARVRNDADAVAYVYAGSAEAAVTKQVTAEYGCDVLLNEAGTLKVGLKSTGHPGNTWLALDHFSILYYGNGVEHYATAAGSSFSAVADTWYAIPVATAGTYSFTTTGGATVLYTQDGTEETSSITASAASGEQLELTAGTIYVKASAASDITFAAASYSYELNTLTSNVQNDYYIQNGVLTFTYPDAVSNDTEATPSLVDNSTANVGGNSVALTAIDNGFQLDLGALTPSQNISVTIPANVYGYEGKSGDDAMNKEITLTLHTPAIFDGTFYLYNTYNEKYLSRGGNYGTQASVDGYGIPVILLTDKDNATEIKMVDSYMNIGIDGWCYTDAQNANVRKFNVTAVSGGYKFLCTSNSKYLATNTGHVVNDAVEGDNLDGTSNVWALHSVNEHLAVFTAHDDAQAAIAATAAGITAANKAELEDAIAEYTATNITITGTDAVKEAYQKGSSNAQTTVPYAVFEEETVTNLTPGLYKLSVNAFQRATWLNDVYYAGGMRGAVYVYANDAQTQLKSIIEEPSNEAYTEGSNPNLVVDGKNFPNSTGAANQAFAKGMYVNDVYVYVEADQDSETGTLRFGIKNPTRLGNDASRGAWVCFNNFTLTKYSDSFATPEQIAALNEAIQSAEAKTLGFQIGEYSPYTNKEAVKAIADAKALDVENPIDIEVLNAAKQALDNAIWTVNTEEMNAVDNGDLEGSYTEKTGTGVTSDRAIYVPEGWTVDYVGNTNDITILNSGDKAANNFTSISTLDNGGNNTYLYRGKWGDNTNITVYQSVTLPAGTYTLSCDAWKSGLGGNGEIFVGEEKINLPNNQEEWLPLSLNFTLNEQKTIKFGYIITHTSNNNEKFIGFDNFVLKTAKAINVTVGSTGFATVGFPFATTLPAGVTGYVINEVSTSAVALTEVPSGSMVAANTGMIIATTAGTHTFEPIASGTDYSDNKLVATSAATYTAVNKGDAYVLAVIDSEKKIVGLKQIAAGATVGLNKSYLPASAIPQGAKPTSLSFGIYDDATGTIIVNEDASASSADVFDLAGRRYSKLQKGVNIVDGNKYIVK